MANAVENLNKHLQLAIRQAHILMTRDNTADELLQIYYFALELQGLTELLLERGPQ